MKKNPSQFYSKKHQHPWPIGYQIVIALLLIITFGLMGFWSTEKTDDDQPQPQDNTQIIVQDSDGAAPETQGVQTSGGIDGELGPAKVEDIIGGTSAQEFYQAPSADKLIEGKDIEIK